MGWPSNVWITSPALSPAFPAGESAVTSSTVARSLGSSTRPMVLGCGYGNRTASGIGSVLVR
jgi:hypothetical protein